MNITAKLLIILCIVHSLDAFVNGKLLAILYSVPGWYNFCLLCRLVISGRRGMRRFQNEQQQDRQRRRRFAGRVPVVRGLIANTS